MHAARTVSVDEHLAESVVVRPGEAQLAEAVLDHLTTRGGVRHGHLQLVLLHAQLLRVDTYVA